jgi:hypothetical protein
VNGALATVLDCHEVIAGLMAAPCCNLTLRAPGLQPDVHPPYPLHDVEDACAMREEPVDACCATAVGKLRYRYIASASSPQRAPDMCSFGPHSVLALVS